MDIEFRVTNNARRYSESTTQKVAPADYLRHEDSDREHPGERDGLLTNKDAGDIVRITGKP